MAKILEETYSCGATVKYLETDSGQTFICHRCGNIHAYPKSPKKVSTFTPRSSWWKTFYSWLQQWFPSQQSITSSKRKKEKITIPKSTKPPSVTLPPNIQATKEELIQLTWLRDQGPMDLSLSAFVLPVPHWEACIRQMLEHAAAIATKLSMPTVVPTLDFQSSLTPKLVGNIQKSNDGSASITIPNTLEYAPKAVLAVLAHELCQYILTSNGIHKSDPSSHREMIEIGIYILGFGSIFNHGYHHINSEDYNTLPTEQYRALLVTLEAAWWTRDTLMKIASEEEELERWAIQTIGKGDRSHYENAFQQIQAKYPQLDKKGVLEIMKTNFSKN